MKFTNSMYEIMENSEQSNLIFLRSLLKKNSDKFKFNFF